MKNKNRVLNLISTMILLLLIPTIPWIYIGVPSGWKLFSGDYILLIPLLFSIPLILSILSLKNKKTVLAKIILSISILLLITTGILALYIFVLGSNWTH